MNPAYMVAAVIAAKRPNPVPTQEVAVQYLCLIYSDESQWPKLPKDEHDRIVGEYLGYMEDIRRSGHYLGCNRLQPTGAATTVRVRGGKLTTTDGPFAETKEQLGGYFLVEARDLNEAIQLAARIPGARYGSIEVRPVREVTP
jgi:hypothetical protein